MPVKRWKHQNLIKLKAFQRRFIAGVMRPGNLTSALSVSRGNGKSTLSAWLSLQTLSPGSPLFEPGAVNHIVASSVGQARRTTFGLLRKMVETLPHHGTDYRISDNAVSARILHTASQTEVSVLPASGKSAMGLVLARWVVADEPASWKASDGQLMADAILDSHGKPGVGLRVIFVGTLSPAGEGHWWPELVESAPSSSNHVSLYQGHRKTWDSWNSIQRANPLMVQFPESRRFLLDQRDKARTDSRLRARFMSYRLNLPSKDESEVVLTVEDWQRSLTRPVPSRDGRPIVGIDLGGSRAWTAAVAIWPNGRTEAVALIPGLPSIREQEKRDSVPKDLYQRLVDSGSLIPADGLRMPPPAQLVEYVKEWRPRVLVCDRFRLSELKDARPPCPIVTRISRWSESSEDIRALRRMATDGPLSVAAGSRQLLQVSLAAARAVSDDSGNVRLRKSSANFSRDDVAQSLILAAGQWARERPRRGRSVAVFAPLDGKVIAI